jgi:putative SOS response-associated peptidase YedK
MAPIHDRMLALLHPTDFARWLSPEVDGAAVAELIRSFPASAGAITSLLNACGNPTKNHNSVDFPLF